MKWRNDVPKAIYTVETLCLESLYTGGSNLGRSGPKLDGPNPLYWIALVRINF